MVKNFTVGADPELFLSKNGEIISAEGMIGGTKDKPKYISDEGHAIQEDNVMVEFNVPPCDNPKALVREINFVKDYLNQLAFMYDCKLEIKASATLDKKYLRTKQAKMFGCDPDFNVYLKDMNTPPKAGGCMRTCGGHIHIGYENPSVEVSELIIFAMDIMLGLESISLDKDTERRKMYGNAGCFRFKDYGVEYRTLSNFWIASDELIEWAFNKTKEAVDLVNSGEVKNIISEFGEEIKSAIDNADKEKSENLLIKIKEKINKKICVAS